jgi:hypothetical protein
MGSVQHLEWNDRNSNRNYPFKEDATLLDTSGTYRLPQDFITDFVFTITLGGSITVETRFYVKKLSVFGGIAAVEIYDENEDLAASFTVIQSGHTRYKMYPLQTFAPYDAAQGKAVIGAASHLFGGVDGRYEFEQATTLFEDTVIIPGIRGVLTLSKYSEFNNFPALTGHVRLEEGINLRITPNVAKNSLRIDAISGEGLGPECDCPEPDPFGGAPGPILTINGIPASDDLNLEIHGVGGIKVEEIENGLKIINTESSPCCSCEEIDLLLERQAELARQLATLQCQLGASTLITSASGGSGFSSGFSSGFGGP